jgi:hypothetical protein
MSVEKEVQSSPAGCRERTVTMKVKLVGSAIGETVRSPWIANARAGAGIELEPWQKITLAGLNQDTLSMRCRHRLVRVKRPC